MSGEQTDAAAQQASAGDVARSVIADYPDPMWDTQRTKVLAREVLHLHEPDQALVERVARAMREDEARRAGEVEPLAAWDFPNLPAVMLGAARNRWRALARAALAALRDES